jgi:site-specific recombinase XerD
VKIHSKKVDKMFKKLFKSFMKQEDEYEFDDVDIVNGKLIFKSEKKQEKETLPKVEEIVSKWEEISKKEIGADINKKIIRENEDKVKDSGLIVIENETQSVIESQKIPEPSLEISKKGRAKDIEGFYTALQSAGRSKLTILNYRYDMKWWQKIAEQKSTTIYNLKLSVIEEAISEMDANTKKRRISSLKQLSKWYLREGFPNLNIETQKIMLGRGKARIPKAKSEEEFREIKEHAKKLLSEGKREGIWILLMVTCGCRISEIQTVVGGKDAITVIGKGDKERKIPCPDYLLEALKKLEPEGRGGYRKKRQVIDRALRIMGYTHLHTLRHTYATVLHHNGLNLEEVSKLLGHADISTTQVYAQTKINEGVTRILDGI